MACAFCAIAAGTASAEIVHRSPEGCAFLDTKPVFKGHVLVVPARHVETLVELDPGALRPFFELVQQVAGAVERGLGAEGSFVAINNRVSQSVPHLHVHVVPRRKGDGLRGFFWPRVKYDSPEERATFAERIRDAL